MEGASLSSDCPQKFVNPQFPFSAGEKKSRTLHTFPHLHPRELLSQPAIEQLCTVLSAGCTEEFTRYQKFMSRFHLYGLHNMAAEAGGCYQVDRESDIRRGLMN